MPPRIVGALSLIVGAIALGVRETYKLDAEAILTGQRYLSDPYTGILLAAGIALIALGVLVIAMPDPGYALGTGTGLLAATVALGIGASALSVAERSDGDSDRETQAEVATPEPSPDPTPEPTAEPSPLPASETPDQTATEDIPRDAGAPAPDPTKVVVCNEVACLQEGEVVKDVEGDPCVIGPLGDEGRWVKEGTNPRNGTVSYVCRR